MDIVHDSKMSSDAALRVEAKIDRELGEYEEGLKKLMAIQQLEAADLDQLGIVISDLKDSGVRLKAIAFYESILNSKEWDSEKYNKMADMLYRSDEKKRALTYYRIAQKKKPDDEWAAYRVGSGGEEKESEKMFELLGKGDTLLSRLAKSKLIEINLMNKVDEVF